MSITNDGLGISLPIELRSLIHKLGLRIVDVQPITTLKSTMADRGTYRLRCDDGRTIKGRVLRQSGKAERMGQVLQHMDQRGFSRVLAYEDRAMLEEWIDGTCLAGFPTTQELMIQAGVMLSNVHTTPVPCGCESVTRPDLGERLSTTLEQLAESGLLSRVERDGLRKKAMNCCPNVVDAGFVHRDFCAENLVLHNSELYSVDNVNMRIGPLDEDLARTWYRWPMTEQQWNAFLAGYGERRNPRNFLQNALYWTIVVLIGSALFRLRIQAPEAAVPVSQLSDILRNGLSIPNRSFERSRQ